MPYYDLDLQYGSTSTPAALSHTLAFAAELGYSTVALSTTITGKLPATPAVLQTSNMTIPSGMTLLTRLTLTISDTSQNHRLSSLQSAYNLVALRPTNEKALQLCCSALQCDIISIDFSQRLAFILKFKTVSSALQRGVRFEICYSPGISGGSDARRNVIAGATALIRATRGRGIILSSEARNALGLRGPHDVMNLACVWGLSQERGKEGVCEEADKVVRLAKLKRETYRGVVAVLDEGRVEAEPAQLLEDSVAEKGKEAAVDPARDVLANGTELKRKASSTSLNPPNNATPATTESEKPVSKRELKRRAKKARLEANSATNKPVRENGEGGLNYGDSSFPIKHEALSARPTSTTSVNHSTKKKS